MPNLPLPEGVADQIQALVKEREARDAFLAARVPGKRNNVRERTDADRAKERERSARRRTTQTTQQREAERLRSLRRRNAMSPEQRKLAGARRVKRRAKGGGLEGGGDARPSGGDLDVTGAGATGIGAAGQGEDTQSPGDVTTRFAPPPGSGARDAEAEELVAAANAGDATFASLDVLGVLDAVVPRTGGRLAYKETQTLREQERQRSAFRREKMTPEEEEKTTDSRARRSRRVRLETPGTLEA